MRFGFQKLKELLGSTPGREVSGCSRPLLDSWPFLEGFPNQEGLEQRAEEALSHRFSFLGREITSRFHGEPDLHPAHRVGSRSVRSLIRGSYLGLDWQKDESTQFRWSACVRSVGIGVGPGSDLRFAWELARFQHLPLFAIRFKQTGEERWWVEFQNQILDFVSANPPRFGSHWICSMEVAIRLVNWIVAFELFRLAGAVLKKQVASVLLDSVQEHGRHILSNLEWDYPRRTNHYLSNLCGVAFAAAFLPRCKETGVWSDWAHDQLETAVAEQFSLLGANLEGSTSYHRLSGEMVLYTAALLTGQGYSFSPSFVRQLHGIARFAGDVTKPDGRVYQLGDNDSGRFLPVVPGPCDDHRPLLSVAAGLLNDSRLLKRSGPWACLASLAERLARGRPLQQVEAGPKVESRGRRTTPSGRLSAHRWTVDTTDLKPTAYPEFGLYLFCSSNTFLAFRCGFVGQMGVGGHAHCDQLSIELFYGGRSVLTEAGTFCYLGDVQLRNAYRSSAAHNSPRLEGEEQADLLSDPFALGDAVEGELLYFGPDGVEGRIRCSTGWLHRRVCLTSDSIEIADWHSESLPFVGIEEFVTGRHDAPSLPLSRAYGLQDEKLVVCSGVLRERSLCE